METPDLQAYRKQQEQDERLFMTGVIVESLASGRGVEEIIDRIERFTLPRTRHDNVRQMLDNADEMKELDPYHQGLYNGIELSLSLLENREPEYSRYIQPPPESWHKRVFGISSYTFYFSIFGTILFGIIANGWGMEPAIVSALGLLIIYAATVPIYPRGPHERNENNEE